MNLKEPKWSWPAQGLSIEPGPTLVLVQARGLRSPRISFTLSHLVNAAMLCGFMIEEAHPIGPQFIPYYS